MTNNGPTKPTPVGGGSATKLIAVVIVVIVVAAAGFAIYEFVYKGGKKTNNTTPSSVTITVWGSGSAGGEATAFNQSLAAFEAAYTNVTVQDSPGVPTASANYLTAANAGTAPDVYRDSSDNAGAAYVAGAVLNLSPYLNTTYINSFTTGTIADWTYQGALYGLPVNTNGIGLYYNKALVPNAPTTLYQMVQDAVNVTNMGSSYLGLPYAIGADSGYRSAAFFPAWGGQLFNSTLYPVLNSTQNIAAMSFVWNWTAVYHVDKTGLTFSNEQNFFENNKSAFMFDGPWDQSTYQKALGSNLGVTAIPFNNVTGKWPAPIWGSQGYLISSAKASGITASQIWASLKFVQWMTNNSSQIALFNQAGDFPSLISAGNYVTAHPGTDSLIGGWLAQEQHTQIQPNYPQMAYYWPNFAIGGSNLEQNSSTVTVTDMMNQIQSLVVNDLKLNGLLISTNTIVTDSSVNMFALVQSLFLVAPVFRSL